MEIGLHTWRECEVLLLGLGIIARPHCRRRDVRPLPGLCMDVTVCLRSRHIAFGLSGPITNPLIATF